MKTEKEIKHAIEGMKTVEFPELLLQLNTFISEQKWEKSIEVCSQITANLGGIITASQIIN